VKVARLKHQANWDPEPLAYERLSRLMARECGVGLEVFPCGIGNLPESNARVASLTGTEAFQPSSQEKEALREFVKGGGLLVVDACGGSKEFAESARKALLEVFGADSLKPLPATARLYTVKEIAEFKYRNWAKVRLGDVKGPLLQGVSVGKKLGVIFSREDLTEGLMGTPLYRCDGYAPQTAYEIMRNVMLLGEATAAREK
jgi:hypothetical protein